MNTKNQKGSAMIVILLIIILGIGGFVLLKDNDADDIGNDDAMMESESMMESEEHNDDSMMKEDEMMEGSNMMEGEAMMENESGKYVSYDSSLLKNAEDGKVVIFFHANWCPTCRLQDTAILDSIKEIPSDVTILKADYDKENELKKKYGVTTQHTFVQVDAQGNLITKWTGGSDLSGIISKLK